MKNSRKLKKAAAEAAAHAADTSHDVLNDGLAKAAEILGDARDKAATLIDEAQKVAVPAAKEASARAADFAAKRLDAWEPHIKGALDRVTPAVDAARERVSDDLLPRLQHMLHEAAEHPAVVEATRRSEATVQALKGELEPRRKKGGKLKTFGKVLAIGALVAGAVAAVRHFLTPKDDGWTAHEPSKAYVNNNDTFATAAKVADEGTVSSATEAPDDAAPVDDADAPEVTPEAAEDAAPETAEDAAPETAEAAEETASEAAEDPVGYGEGSYVGENPPEGFVIKGNERSKKYHLAGSGGYERTIAEVWFNSEEAAEAAGFTKAQR